MTIRARLLQRLKDRTYRHAYLDEFVNGSIATQIKVLREQRGLTQAALANRARMRQSQISDLEDVHHTAWKVGTLKKLAKALDVALVVRFESFGGLLPLFGHLDRAGLERPSFDDDPAFTESEIRLLSMPAARVTTATRPTSVLKASNRYEQEEISNVA